MCLLGPEESYGVVFKGALIFLSLMLHKCYQVIVVYDRNHYFGLGPILKPNPKLADTFGRYRNHISNEEYSY